MQLRLDVRLRLVYNNYYDAGPNVAYSVRKQHLIRAMFYSMQCNAIASYYKPAFMFRAEFSRIIIMQLLYLLTD